MEELKKIYRENLEKNYIDASLYPRYRVKQGLRNENGTGVKVGLTKICDVIGYQMIHGHKHNSDGRLIYRGHDLTTLVKSIQSQPDNLFGFETVAFLLIFGRLPQEEELAKFNHYLKNEIHTDMVSSTYQTASLLNAMQIEVLKLYGQDEDPDDDLIEDRLIKGIQILASLPLFVFSNYNHEKITAYPDQNKSLAENILMMARQSQGYTLQEAKALDTLLMVHADHGGGNNSTFANVVLSSTGTDIYSCICAAIGSLKGPRHGGAAAKTPEQFEAIKKEVGITSDPAVLEDIVYKILGRQFNDRSGLIYGIGHAIYTKSDPRAILIKEQAKALAQEKGRMAEFEMLETFENVACKTLKVVKGQETCANVDFYSGFAYSLLGIDSSLFTPLFAISRTSGWIAHHLENRQSNRKLIRPANIYVGEHYNEQKPQ